MTRPYYVVVSNEGTYLMEDEHGLWWTSFAVNACKFKTLIEAQIIAGQTADRSIRRPLTLRVELAPT